MTKLKNGLYVDFLWNEEHGIPLIYVSDRSDKEGTVLMFNLQYTSLEEAIKQALQLIPTKEEEKNY